MRGEGQGKGGKEPWGKGKGLWGRGKGGPGEAEN